MASLSAFTKLGRMSGVSAAIVREIKVEPARSFQLPGPSCPNPSRVMLRESLMATSRPGLSIASLKACSTLLALPGMSLAIYEPISGLVLDLILEENAHRQERGAARSGAYRAWTTSGSWIATSAFGPSCSGS